MRKFFRRLFKIVRWMTLVLFVWLLLPLDHFTALAFSSPHPDAIVRLGGGHKTAFVFFAGDRSSGLAASAPLRPLWEQHADVVVVQYNPIRFDGRQTAFDTYSKLREWGYPQVILDGASPGGLLAADVIDDARALGGTMRFAVVMQNAPMDSNDLTLTGADPMTWVWWPGFVTDWVATKPFWYVLDFFGSPPRQSGSGADDQQVAAQYQISDNYPLSGWRDQIRYIAHHQAFERNEYVGVPFFYMQSSDDNVVEPTFGRWSTVFGGGTLIHVSSDHDDFVGHPDAWRAAFERVFRALPGW